MFIILLGHFDEKRYALSFVSIPQHKSTLLYCMLPRYLKLSSHNNNCSVFHPFYLIGIDLLKLSMCMFYMYQLFKYCFVWFVFFLGYYGLRILHEHEVVP